MTATLVDAPDGRRLHVVPLVPEFAVFPNNAYLVALHADVAEPPVGWMLHLPWAKNPAPMNRSGARGGWRAAARQAATVRDVAFQLALRRIPLQRRIRVRLDWHVTTRRIRDEDNLVRCMKHLVDGLKLAGVVEDDHSEFVRRDMPSIVLDPEGYAHMRLFVLVEP